MKPVSPRPTNRKRANLRKVGKSLAFNSIPPSRSDPTRTHSIRRPFLQEIRRRYALLKGRLVHLIVDENSFSLTSNADFSFQTNPDQLASFQEWLRTQIDSVGLTDEQLWARYVEAGYKRGAGRAFDDTRPRGYHRTQETDEFYQGGRDEFLRGLTQPVAVEKVKLLASRTFADIKNVTHDLATRMGRVLVDGLVTGQSPRAVARTLSSELDFSRHRALTVARTELIRAHAEGQLDSFQRLGVQELGVEVEWSASGRPEMCEECAELDGTIMTIDQARGMIPRHPNCACAWVPSIKVPKPTRNIFNPDQPRDEHGRFTAGHMGMLDALKEGPVSRKALATLLGKDVSKYIISVQKGGHAEFKEGKYHLTSSGRSLLTGKPEPTPTRQVTIPPPSSSLQGISPRGLAGHISRLADKRGSIGLADLHDAVGKPDLGTFHKAINDLRRAGAIMGEEHEGRFGITEREEATALTDPSSRTHGLGSRITSVTITDRDLLRKIGTSG